MPEVCREAIETAKMQISAVAKNKGARRSNRRLKEALVATTGTATGAFLLMVCFNKFQPGISEENWANTFDCNIPET
jgi:hypothetical protein